MNKISKIFLLVLVSLSFGTISQAEVKMGISVSGLDMSPSAKEELWDGHSDEKPAEIEDIQVPFASIFVEKDLGIVSLGVDLSPYDTTSDELNNVRTNTGGAGDQDTTDAKVEVTIKVPVMIYALLQNDAGAFLKLGASFADVKTKETTPTGSQYPDTEVYGGHISVGFERPLADTGYDFRVEGGYSGYTNITVVNDDSERPSKIHVQDLDGMTARVSILKTF